MTLSRFLSRSAETAAPIFNTLKKGDTFVWTTENEEVFLRLKAMSATPPILTKPTPGTLLVIYISVVEEVVSVPMVQEREGKQHPIYFIILKKLDLAGRMVAWSAQLFEFDISYESKGHIKAEALADFITKMTAGSLEAKTSGGWLLSVDEASNQVGSGVGVILEGSNGVLIEQSLHFEFKANNNQAEYEALLVGMRLASELEAKVLTAKSNSKLMTGQARDPQLVKYLDRTAKLVTTFEKFTLHHVPREQNEWVDLLSKLATSQKRGVHKSIIHESIGRPIIEEPKLGCVEEHTTWMSPLMAYLRDEIKPEDLVKVKKLIKEAARYIIIGGELHRKGFSFPLLRCIEGEDAHYVIKEVHEGLCGSYIGGRALASKIAKVGYYWPTLKGDCMDYVRRCDKCQRFAKIGNAPSEQLHAITSL
ncbi:hypothetical protein CR513_18099, partial [Mucuna pruriens]